AVHAHRPRPVDERLGRGAAVALVGLSDLALAPSRPGERGDRACLQVEPANAPAAHVGDEQPALAVEEAIIRLDHARLRPAAAVPSASLLPVAGHGGHDARLAVHLADAQVQAVTDVEVALGRNHDGVRLVESGFRSRPAVAGEALLAGAGDGDDHACLQVEAAD